MKNMTHKKVPFQLDLSSRNTLASQMTNALRQAIVAGLYRPGEVLPTIREWAKMLGVSMRVPEAAIPRLVKEGLVVARPRHGCIVAPYGATIFKGHVLFVMPPKAYYTNPNIMCGRLTEALENARYFVSSIRVRQDTCGRNDFSRLRLVLRQSVDLAVFIYRDSSAALCAKELGIPFMTIHNGYLAGTVMHAMRDDSTALGEMADDFAAHGIRTLWIVAKGESGQTGQTGIFRRKGIKVKTVPVPANRTIPQERHLEALMRASQTRFENICSRGLTLPDAIYFTDDFLAAGAVPVLLMHGIRVPADVKIATLSNYGRVPAFPFPFAQIEYNAYRNGDLLADCILSYFEKRDTPQSIKFASRYIPAKCSS